MSSSAAASISRASRTARTSSASLPLAKRRRSTPLSPSSPLLPNSPLASPKHFEDRLYFFPGAGHALHEDRVVRVSARV